MIMPRGGFAQLPDGSVIVALTLPRPAADTARHADADTAPARSPYANAAPGASPHPARASTGSRAGALRPEPRRWSAHADEAHTVRAASASRRRPGDEPRVRVLVHSLNRARALTRLRNLGLRAVYLNGNVEPPTADEITAVLHHPEGLVWRASPDDECGSWHPIAALLRPAGHRTRTV